MIDSAEYLLILATATEKSSSHRGSSHYCSTLVFETYLHFADLRLCGRAVQVRVPLVGGDIQMRSVFGAAYFYLSYGFFWCSDSHRHREKDTTVHTTNLYRPYKKKLQPDDVPRTTLHGHLSERVLSNELADPMDFQR